MARVAASGQYLTAGSPSTFFTSILTTRSLSFWVYPTTSGATVLSATGGAAYFDIITGGDYNVYFQCYASGTTVSCYTTSHALQAYANTWVHVLVANVNGAYVLYVNGVLYSGGFTNIAASGSGGAYNGSDGAWFDAVGTLDHVTLGALYTGSAYGQNEGNGFSEIAIFDNLPSGSDITALAGGTPANSTSLSSATQTALKHYYADDAGGATWVDAKNSAYNATNTGTTQFTVSGSPSSPPVNISTVSSLTVTPSTTLAAGLSTRQFAAVVNGTGSPSQAVTWSKTGAVTINSSGLATFGAANGTAQAWSVTATSVQDSSKSATISGTISAVTVTISGNTFGTDGGTVNLTASGGTAYTWGTDAGAISTGGVLTLPSTGSGTCHVTATDATGAIGTYSVMYSAGEAVAAITGPTSLNQGQAGTYLCSVLNPTSSHAFTFAWTDNVGALSGGITNPTATSSQLIYTAGGPSAAGVHALACQVQDTTSSTSVGSQNLNVTIAAVAISFQSSASCQTGGTASISLPTVTGAVNTATTLTGTGAAYYAGGVFTPPGGAAAGATYMLIETSVADPTKSATCTITLTNLTVLEVSWGVGTPNLTGVTVQADNGVTGTLAAPVSLSEVVVGGVHTGVYSGNITLNTALRTKLLFCDGNGNYAPEYLAAVIPAPAILTASELAALDRLYAMTTSGNQFAAGVLPASGGGLSSVALPLQISSPGLSVQAVTRFDWKQRQTAPQFALVLGDANGVPVNLTGATVRLRLTPLLGGSAISEIMTLLYPAGGQVGYTFADADVAVAGTYRLEVEAILSNGAYLYFPSDGTITFVIHPSLGGPVSP